MNTHEERKRDTFVLGMMLFVFTVLIIQTCNYDARLDSLERQLESERR